MELYRDLIGQDQAIKQLRAAAISPVHAYLFVGPPGIGKRAAARSFAAALLCADGGCGNCSICERVLKGTHPDVLVFERDGPFITMKQASEISRKALLSPVEASRQVLTLVDFHLVRETGPALLKTIEEPHARTVFVILAEHVPNDLVTIASRCVTVEFRCLSESQIVQALVNDGVDAEMATEISVASGGRMDRARLLANDHDFRTRHAAWSSIPSQLDGTGATAAQLVDELMTHVAAAVEPLEAEQRSELSALEERAKMYGEKNAAARKDVVERHKREQRRVRMDEFRFGFATLSGAYRDRLKGESNSATARQWFSALTALQQASEALLRNPNETLLMQSLMLRLSPPPA